MENTTGKTTGYKREIKRDDEMTDGVLARGPQRAGLSEARQLVVGLRALGAATVPETLLAGVLGAVGLADTYFTLESPLGPIYIASNARGISAVARAEDPAAFEAAFRARLGRPIAAASQPNDTLARALETTLRGERRSDLRFDLRGVSEFERAVLLKALEIPRGEVRPYGWIAREIGRPRAVRAVGTALAHNPIPLLIPCHRVVRSDGSLGEYSLGGGAAKRRILAAEAVDPDALERLARAGIRYNGSDTTHIYCFPTCRHARRTTPTHLVRFRSQAEAEAAGYRPCRVCRPA
jgi:O-6-methylguanine DNA methyltransferase